MFHAPRVYALTVYAILLVAFPVAGLWEVDVLAVPSVILLAIRWKRRRKQRIELSA
jgi:hypothetical protein